MDNTLNQSPKPCDELLLSAYLDGEVTPDERAAAESHLESCAPCRSFIDTVRRAEDELRRCVVPAIPRARVLDQTRNLDSTGNQRRRFAWRIAWAAAAFVCVMTGLALGLDLRTSSVQRIARTEPHGTGAIQEPSARPPVATVPRFETQPVIVPRRDMPPAAGDPAQGVTALPPKLPDHAAPTTSPQTPDKPAMAALNIELPAPYFGGTPLSYFSDNLEEPNYKPRPPFLAPIGARLLSKGRPVTSSESSPRFGRFNMLTDGAKGYEQAHLIELAAGTQYVQVDLGGPCTLYAIVVWHFFAADRVYFDVIVRAAADETFTKNLVELYNNDIDDSSGLGIGRDKEYIESNEGRLIDCHGKVGRYVRCYSNGNTTDEMNHYVEVEVWGIPVDSTAAGATSP